MRISSFSFFSILLVLLTIGSGAYAFDPSKVVHEEASTEDVFDLFFDFRKDGRESDAVSVLEYAADNGDFAAQWKLARIYETGDGVERDPLKAFNFFQKIASRYASARPNTANWQFSASALVALGNYYRRGIPGTWVKPDRASARMMYTTAATIFRHPDAEFELGRMQLQKGGAFGMGIRGIANLGKAHRKGHIGATAVLGYAIFNGDHVERNPVRGLVLLGQARHRADVENFDWISEMHDEAMSLATPQERAAAATQLNLQLASD